jgi:putative membrane protein
VAFLVILATHTLLAVVVVPMILRTIFLGLKDRLEEHKRLARITFGIWFYVAVTGVFIYVMNNLVRPH